MTRDDIIRMADEADLWADQELQCIGEYHPDWHEVRDVRFAALVAAAEREACATVCEDLYAHVNYDLDCRKHWPERKRQNGIYAAAIRARGQA